MRNDLTISELDSELAELLPARETLSGGTNNWATLYASNSSFAMNVASYHSWAGSTATQNIHLTQH